MISSLLYILIVALVVCGAVPGGEPPKSPSGSKNAPQGLTINPTDPLTTDPLQSKPEIKVDPPSSHAIKILDKLGLTKKARQQLAPIDIPEDLTGKTDSEIMSYARLLMHQRRALQRRMTRYMAYNAFLMVILHFFGYYPIVNGGITGLFWLNNNYRATINADWMIHQEQLGQFIMEYMRVKDVNLKSLSKSRVVGRPIIRVKFSEKDAVEFPVWVTAKGQPIPKESEIHAPLLMFRNWWARK